MIQLAIKYKQIVFYVLFLICVGGIYSYIILPKQEAPDINPPVTMITAVYPGASQSDMEQFVTSKIEDTLMDMEAYDYGYSYSYNSVATVVAFMKYGNDTDQLWTDLRREMDDLQDTLPNEVQKLDVMTDLSDTAGMLISLTGADYDYDMLGFYGESIVDDLRKVDGVTKFDILGEVGKEVRITVDAEAMNRLGISYDELTTVLKGQNLEIPSGTIETDEEDIPLIIKGSFESIDDMKNIILDVSKDNYSVLKLKDIATVEFADEEAPRIFYRDGEKSILLVGYFEDNKNVLSIGDDVRRTIDGIKSSIPDDLRFEEVVFQPKEVDRSLNGFIQNLLLGILLVIIVVFVGMGLRNAIVVSFAIPTSILTTLLVMPLFGLKLHAISITAFIVALGMLVDNAIVVSDSIQNKLDEGIERMEACIFGTKEVIISILSSTLTTIAAFSPLILLNSVAGDYVKSLPQVVIIALIASFFFAFLVTPTLAYVFFKVKPHNDKVKPKTIMQQLLEYGLRKKVIAFIIGIVIIGILGSSFLMLNIIFFPKTDKTVMYIDIKAEKNIDTAYTKTVTDQIEAILEEEDGVTHYTTAIGGGIPKYYDTLGIFAQIPENAQILMEIDLKTAGYNKNTSYAKDLQKKIDETLVGGQATVKELEYAEPISAPIYIRMTGPDGDGLWKVASELQKELEQIPGAANVRTDYDPYIYEYEIVLDEDVLSYYGLMKYDVLNEVSIALRGREAGDFRSQGEAYTINVTSDITSIEEVDNLMIKSSATGNKHLLKDIGDVKLVKIKPTIRKYEGENAIALMCDLDKGYDSGGIEKAFKERIKNYDLGNVTLTYDGESSKIGLYFGNLGFTAVFAVVMIFTILLIQFRNFRQSLIILLSLPLSAAGAMFGLFIMDQPISFTGMLGIISLIGIVVNNAIVLMEYVNMKRDEGMSVDAAAVSASVVRFRPIILSTITTVIGLLPLMLSNSELFKPMSVALVFGLLVSTFLTLVFIPLTYSLVYHNEDQKAK